MQKIINEKQPLFNEEGRLNAVGYATNEMLMYHRNMIKASKWRIKEWDYYATLNHDFGISATIADLGYLGLINVVFFDFTSKKIIKKDTKILFPFGKLKLPSSIEVGDIHFKKKGFDIEFKHDEDKRVIKLAIQNFYMKQGLECELDLKKMNDDHMMIITPWKENEKAFYYNQKINCIPSKGYVFIGETQYLFTEDRSFSVLDWGRGVWTYKNTWYWSSASGLVEGKRFGFNLGYGFGDTSSATENMLFYEGKAHKLNDVSFEFDSPMSTWFIKSNDGRVSLEMKPILNRKDNTNMLIIKNLGDQVFGMFNGTVILDDGKKLEVKDLLGFAEEITNHY